MTAGSAPNGTGSAVLVAHRGYAGRFPENTLAAVAAALEAGARWLEIDVQLDADGVPHLMHDRTLERACGRPGALHELSTAAVAALRAAEAGRFGARFADEPVAPLAAVAARVAAHPEARLFVELKRVAVEQHGAAACARAVAAACAPLGERWIPISFSLPALAAFRGLGRGAVGAILERWDQRGEPGLRALDPEYVFCNVEKLPPEGPLAVGGARLVVYEVVEAAVARALLARGAALVETFLLPELRAALDAAREAR